MSTISSLAKIIAEGVANIQAGCDSRNVSFPSLDESPTAESEAIRQEVYSHVIPVIAAAHRLIATLQHPSLYAVSTVMSLVPRRVLAARISNMHLTKSLQGLHSDGIAVKNDMGFGKLSRILCLLANEHIFKEVYPDVYKSISATLDSGNAQKLDLRNYEYSPQDRYKAASGLSSFIGLIINTGDESMKASTHMSETLLDAYAAHSDEPDQTGFNCAFETGLGVFQCNSAMKNYEVLCRRVLHSKTDSSQFTSMLTFPSDFNWDALPESSLVVDVGGGIGTMVLTLSGVYQHLRYVVQDLSATVEQGIQEDQQPHALMSGLVQFQKHNVFEPQPVQNASVLILRGVLHDWSDRYAIKIIRLLREAASPETKLLVVDCIVRYTCSDNTDAKGILGADQVDAPRPLLGNYGIGGGVDYKLDIQMMAIVNGCERTLRQFVDILRSCGWRLDSVTRSEGEQLQQLIASPL
ncbi:hypothetical protein CERSUDRAFT_47409 [Gelatoporia subvermispora B]|uniref:O-methyltransferase C-terminal domain-containing protein n=1 Tax=Ceriporiopsis subvermispora (strain B) TaxID=914234 RepID=M2QPR6_CERS8|nr:hypothetical protein CERSUDRAFT_47409 [Gelatoporia subvermispora B]